MGYNGVGQDEINQIIQTNDGYAIAVGYHSDPGFTTGGTSLFVVKIGNENAFPANGNQSVYSILNVENLESNTAISIYPNPFTESIQIDSDSNIDYLEVLDLTGKKIYSNATQITSIETSDWQKGTYLVRCQSNGVWYTGRMVKY
ncbi:hypothetical protein D3C86_1681650 [compost metagenome]